MSLFRLLPLAILLLLAGCLESALHLSVRLQRVDGLAAGDAVVFRGQPVGEVDQVEYSPAGVFLAHIHIAAEYREAATTATRFYLADDPAQPGKRRIEVEHPGGGQALAENAVVDGGNRSGLGGLFPFDAILQGMGEGLRQFRGQVEQLQRGLEKLPQSEDAKKLEEEWQRLMEQLDQAGKNAEKDWEPRLRQRLEELDRRFRQLEPKSPAPPPQRRDGHNI